MVAIAAQTVFKHYPGTVPPKHKKASGAIPEAFK
jgi:hypothetical protein